MSKKRPCYKKLKNIQKMRQMHSVLDSLIEYQIRSYMLLKKSRRGQNFYIFSREYDFVFQSSEVI